MTVRCRAGYALAALLVFLIEVCIALFVRDAFVRPYLGDVLAVVLVYLALRAATPLGVRTAAGIALAIAFAVELGQYLEILHALGLADSRVARILLGSHFEWQDLAAYTAGAALVLAAEAWRSKRTP